MSEHDRMLERAEKLIQEVKEQKNNIVESDIEFDITATRICRKCRYYERPDRTELCKHPFVVAESLLKPKGWERNESRRIEGQRKPNW